MKTFKDIYELPFIKLFPEDTWIYDQKDNFCFQFETYRDEIEKAYFEEQKDAINGDVRIRKNNDGCWVWTKSCWNGNEPPKFNPSIIYE